MKTAFEKIRILSIAGAKGELQFDHFWNGGRKPEIFRFEVKRNAKGGTYPLLYSTNSHEEYVRPGASLFIDLERDHVLLWEVVLRVRLTLKIRYSEFQILWATYEGDQRMVA